MSSSLAFNIGILKTPFGFLKLFEAIIGLMCFSLFLSNEYITGNVGFASAILFLVNFPFLLNTFLMLVSILISPDAANTLPKIIFEFVYNLVGFLIYLAASLALLALASKHPSEGPVQEKVMALAVLGLINAVLFFVSTYYSFRSYKSS